MIYTPNIWQFTYPFNLIALTEITSFGDPPLEVMSFHWPSPVRRNTLYMTEPCVCAMASSLWCSYYEKHKTRSACLI